MGAKVSCVFMELMVCSHSKVQVKITPFSVSQCNSFAMIALINCMMVTSSPKVVEPLGAGQDLILLVFSGSSNTNTTCPRYVCHLAL